MGRIPDWAQDRLDDEASMGGFEPKGFAWVQEIVVGVALTLFIVAVITLSIVYDIGVAGAALGWWSK